MVSQEFRGRGARSVEREFSSDLRVNQVSMSKLLGISGVKVYAMPAALRTDGAAHVVLRPYL
jgi:hypothetical protein